MLKIRYKLLEAAKALLRCTRESEKEDGRNNTPGALHNLSAIL